MGITKQSNALFLYMDVQENIPGAGSVETNKIQGNLSGDRIL